MRRCTVCGENGWHWAGCPAKDCPTCDGACEIVAHGAIVLPGENVACGTVRCPDCQRRPK